MGCQDSDLISDSHKEKYCTGDWTAHFNHIQIDEDRGHMYLSARDLNSIMKVDMSTGDLVWSLGGPMNNFDLNDVTGESTGLFFGQHNVEKKNNTFWMFDNGVDIFANSTFRHSSRLLSVTFDEHAMRLQLTGLTRPRCRATPLATLIFCRPEMLSAVPGRIRSNKMASRPTMLLSSRRRRRRPGRGSSWCVARSLQWAWSTIMLTRKHPTAGPFIPLSDSTRHQSSQMWSTSRRRTCSSSTLGIRIARQRPRPGFTKSIARTRVLQS